MSSLIIPIPTEAEPLGYRVLIYLPSDNQEEKSLIEIPESSKDKERQHIVEGYLVGMGDMAFSDMVRERDNYPKIGALVRFVKYAGGDPFKIGDHYFRAMNDTDLYIVGGCHGIKYMTMGEDNE